VDKDDVSGDMTRSPRQQLAYSEWPLDLRRGWEAVFKAGDFLDDRGRGAHLAPTTRAALKASLGRFLGFLEQREGLLAEQTVDQTANPCLVADYVRYRRHRCSEQTIAIELHHLRLALSLIYPRAGWDWLLAATKRIGVKAKPKRQKHHLVTSEQLYALGIALMDQAIKSADTTGAISKRTAFDYRDGLMIAFLAAIPLRRRTFAALRLGKHLVKSGSLWALDIPAEDVKNRRALEFSIAAKLSARIDLYLKRFRYRIPGASNHDGVWASNKGCVMDDGAIYDMVRRRTRTAFGFPVNLHRFRHAAMTFWSTHDPENVRGAKDLLGHASFTTTEKHYLIARSRVAGRRLAQIVDQRAGKGG
jgi:integrase